MVFSNLNNRRIHISGSVSEDPTFASAEDVDKSRKLIMGLVRDLVSRGVNFVVPIDNEPERKCDKLPICFDWLVWKTLKESVELRPSNVSGPFVYGVLHEKSKNQIPPKFKYIWDEFILSNCVEIINVMDWNMNSIRMEEQAKLGDILIVLGGTDGVNFLANKYHARGKPVIPLNIPICKNDKGSKKIYKSSSSRNTDKFLFQTTDGKNSHSWLSKLNFESNWEVNTNLSILVDLLEAIEKPTAFAIRLLSENSKKFIEVEEFFTSVVKPVIEDNFGYNLVTINNDYEHKKSHINLEIFDRLYKSNLVLADLTGKRMNCFIELGYSLGREIPTVIMARKGTTLPFDILTYSTHFWLIQEKKYEESQKLLIKHLNSIRNRKQITLNTLLVQ